MKNGTNSRKWNKHRGIPRTDLGSAIITALMITLALSVIIGSSLSRSLFTWNESGRSYHRENALHVAESGVEMTIYALNHQRANARATYSGDFGSVLRGLSQLAAVPGVNGDLADANGQAVGSYATTVTIDPTNVNRAFVEATGTAPPESVSSNSRENRRLQVVIERINVDPEVFDTAIYTPTWIDTNGITEIHGNTISGNQIRSSGNVDPHLRVTQYQYSYWDDATETVQTAFGACDEGRNEDADPDNDVVLPFDEFTLEAFKEIAVEQGHYFDTEPRAADLPTTFFQPDGVTPNVVFITSSVKMAGNFTIGGIIFVVGDIISDPANAEFAGNDRINGIIYTTGVFRTSGGGNKAINVDGGVFCGSANMQGHAIVSYNWQYMKALEDIALLSMKYRFVSWHEVTGGDDASGS